MITTTSQRQIAVNVWYQFRRIHDTLILGVPEVCKVFVQMSLKHLRIFSLPKLALYPGSAAAAQNPPPARPAPAAAPLRAQTPCWTSRPSRGAAPAAPPLPRPTPNPLLHSQPHLLPQPRDELLRQHEAQPGPTPPVLPRAPAGLPQTLRKTLNPRRARPARLASNWAARRAHGSCQRRRGCPARATRDPAATAAGRQRQALLAFLHRNQDRPAPATRAPGASAAGRKQ